MFRFEPQATGPLLGLFRRGRIALEVHRTAPLLAVEPHSRVSFRLSAPFAAAETLRTLYEQCYAVVEVGWTLKLRPRACGGGCCGSKKNVVVPAKTLQQNIKQEELKQNTEPTGAGNTEKDASMPKEVNVEPQVQGAGSSGAGDTAPIPPGVNVEPQGAGSSGAGDTGRNAPMSKEVKVESSISGTPGSKQPEPRVPTPPDPRVALRRKLKDHLRPFDSGLVFKVDCMVNGQRRELNDTMNNYVKEENRKTLLILGDSGTGKSRFSRHFAAKLLDSLSDLIPVYIDLSLCTDLAKAVSDTFRYYGIEESEIRNLALLFIFDSFDRLKPYRNILETSQVLNTFPNSSIIVTCSNNITSEPQYKSLFVRNGESPLTSLIELSLLTLSAEEIQRDVLTLGSEFYKKKGWKGVMEYIKTLETLKVNNPFILEMCYLHKDLLEKHIENNQLNVPRFLLAAASAELPPLHQSPEDNIKEYVKLAFDQPLSSALPRVPDDSRHILLQISDSQKPTFSVSLLRSVFQAYGFFTDFEGRGSGQYFRTFSATDPSVLRFLADFLNPANEDPKLRDSIARMLDSNSTAAANCIAICAACGVPLPPCNLLDASLKGVNLQGAVYRSVDFSQVNFAAADVSRALFIDCNMAEPDRSQRTQPSIRVDEASALAVTQDGTYLAYAQGNDIHLLTTANFSEVCSLKGHESQVKYMCFSDDGLYLVSVGFDGTMKWWTIPGGEVQHTEKLPKRNYGALAISPAAVVAMAGAPITLWTNSGPYDPSQLPVDSPSTTIAFSKAAKDRLASGHKDKQVRIWSISTSQVLATINLMEPIRGLCFPALDVIAATTEHVYCCRQDGTKEGWGSVGGEVAYCGFDARGTYLGCSFADRDGGCVFDIKSRRSVLPFLQGPLLIAISGECLYMSDSEEVTKLDFNSALPGLKGKEQRITGIAVSEDCGLIATALSSREVQVRERTSGKLRGSVKQQVTDMWIDNNQLCVLTTDNAFLRYSLEDFSSQVDPKADIVLYTTDGVNSAFCSKANVLEVVAREGVFSLPPPENSIDEYTAIRLRADRLVGVKSKGAVVAWKYASGEQELKPFLFSRKHSTCGFTSDNSLLAVINRQDQVEIADIDQANSIGHYEWPAKGELKLAFVRKDYLIACTNDTVIVCKVEGLQVLSELGMSAMRNVTVSADGRYLAAGELALEVFKLHIAEERNDQWSQHMTAVLRENFARETQVIGRYRK